MEEKFWTVAEVAEELRLEERSVRDRLRRQEIKGIRPGGKGKWLIAQSEVDRLLGHGETVKAADAAARLAAQLYTPPPEIILIRDFGGPGTHRAPLEQNSVGILLRDLGWGEGFRVTEAIITSALAEPENREIHWRVAHNGSLELRCPLQEDPSFQRVLSSLGSAGNAQLEGWNREGGHYLATCRDVLTLIHEDAKERTRAGIAEDLIAGLPKKGPHPPQPLPADFGDVVYQLAVLCCRAGSLGLPGPLVYRQRRRGLLFSDLILGQAGIHLATAPHVLMGKWEEIHRSMIREWSESAAIAGLLNSFNELRRLETAIKTEWHRLAWGH